MQPKSNSAQDNKDFKGKGAVKAPFPAPFLQPGQGNVIAAGITLSCEHSFKPRQIRQATKHILHSSPVGSAGGIINLGKDPNADLAVIVS